MKRKIISQANQAFTITLPIDWVRKHNLTKNSEIDLAIDGKSIRISTDEPVHGSSVNVNFSDFQTRNIYNHLLALYAKGIDEIEITSSKEISAILVSALNTLIGFALISQKDNKYIIKDINPGNYPDLDEIFKRVFQMILLFFDAAVNDIFGSQSETLETLKSRDLEVNKFCMYLQRAINKMSYDDPIKGRIIFTYSFALEKLSDEIERLWRTNIKYKVVKNSDIKNLIETSKDGVGLAFSLYYRFEPKNIEKIYALRDKVREKSLQFKGLNADTTRFVRHVVKVIEEAADLNHLTLLKNL